jgi:internalin A
VIVTTMIGAATTLLVLAWLADVVPWSSRARLARQISDVKAGKTTRLWEADPKLLEVVLKDEDCASKITEVVISPVNVSDSEYCHLKQLPHLQAIRLEYIDNVDQFLENIHGMTSLEELTINRARISEAGLRHLSTFPRLTQIHIHNATDDMLRHFGELTQLRSLELSYGTVSDAGLEHLARLTRLQTLDLWYTKVTSKGVAKLQQALPECMIKRKPQASDERQEPNL